MQVELVSNNQVLRKINHGGQDYIEAPPEGAYQIRLTNNSPHRCLAVVTVDGLNVNDGTDGAYDGSGYALDPWRSITLKGWLRSNSEVAAFEFRPNEGSYVNQTGRGTKNTGIVGVAVFDEKIRPVIAVPPPLIIEHHHHHPQPVVWPIFPQVPRGPFWLDYPQTICSSEPGVRGLGDVPSTLSSVAPPMTTASYSAGDGPATKGIRSAAPRGGGPRTVKRSARVAPEGEVKTSGSLDLGTGYGSRQTQHTTFVSFERASSSPSFVVTLRYAVRAKLAEWGVPVDAPVAVAPAAPSAFPAAPGFAQPPAGWGG
jgi:hypothetical protein